MGKACGLVLLILNNHTTSMKFVSFLCIFATASAWVSAKEVPLFNGKNLIGWTGESGYWSVQGGAITGRTTPEKTTAENTFLIWEGEAGDFELRFRFKMTDAAGKTLGFANSGVQYRSNNLMPEISVLSGYQVDFQLGKDPSGMLYEERGRAILAKAGQKVIIHEGVDPADPKKPNIELVGPVAETSEEAAAPLLPEWNECLIVAKGNHLQHFINGRLTVDVRDESPAAAKSGTIGLELHAGAPMEVQFKDIILKTAD
jgi:Domain of Unknown Function (DUF1080)